MSATLRILVAMSGGVDSSVAAAILRDAGHEVTGVFMCMGLDGGGSCCSPADSADARSVAARLGIGFHVLDFAGQFDRLIDDYVAEYCRGRTPNPCVRCNSQLKFGRLLELADALGIDAVATGHYARIVSTTTGPRLARGLDLDKDQSYVLFELTRQTLRRVVLPLGEWSKPQVRARAAELGLGVADKPDSQDICFVPPGQHGPLIEQRRPGAIRRGDVLDSAGRVIGQHRGFQHYTIGQRRGLGIAAGEPIYVTAIDPTKNTVTVGDAEQLRRRQLTCSGVVWHDDVPCTAGSGADEQCAIDAFVKIRYRAAPARAKVYPLSADRVRIVFESPVSAVTPGQAAVFYDDAGLVIGGGWIEV